jgi:hypothetical protein
MFAATRLVYGPVNHTFGRLSQPVLRDVEISVDYHVS